LFIKLIFELFIIKVNTFHFFLCHCSTVWICKIFFVFSNMIQDFVYLCILIPCVCILYKYLYLCVFAQLPMQPLPIITDVSMNLYQGDVYNIM
jgi:hypothetical protein